MAVITIRGTLGSGAPEIGIKVAERLHIDYIDREIISEVASNLKIDEQEIIIKETPACTLREQIGEALTQNCFSTGLPGAPPMLQIPLDDHSYVTALSNLIKNLAESHSAVIYGRGSQIILKEHTKAFHISVIAPLTVRLSRVMKTLKLNEKQARDEISYFDNSALAFLKKYFGTVIEDSFVYDLVINTKRLSFDIAVAIIIEAFRFKFERSDQKDIV